MIADPGPPSPIRVVLRIADGPVPAFVGRAIEAIIAVPGVEVVLVLKDHAPPLDRASGPRLQRLLAAVYERLERARASRWTERAGTRATARAVRRDPGGP